MDDALLPQEPPRNPRAGEVLTKLEDIFETLVDPSADRLTLHIRGRELRFPGGNAKESWRFAVLLKIMELTHEALVTGVITTKRNIYYRAPQLFLRQTVVDRYIDDLAHTLEVPRAALNIVATAKGLLFGPLTVKKHDGQVTDCAADAEVSQLQPF
jgi:meiotic recombination protein SPO11